MISLQQWRMTIGCFCPSNFKTYCRNDFENSECCFRGKMPFILVSIILSLLLVMAGDVEPNPQAHLENVHITNLRFQYAKKKM